MKAVIIVLFAGSTLVSGCRLVKYAQIICKEKSHCENFTLNNGLSLRFDEAFYSFSFRRNNVEFRCELENKSNNPLIFDRQQFSIVSKEFEYNVMPESIYKGRIFPDTFSLAPGESDKNFVFYFRSKNTMSRKEFKKISASDTLKLMFANGDKKETILRLIPKTERD